MVAVNLVAMRTSCERTASIASSSEVYKLMVSSTESLRGRIWVGNILSMLPNIGHPRFVYWRERRFETHIPFLVPTLPRGNAYRSIKNGKKAL